LIVWRGVIAPNYPFYTALILPIELENVRKEYLQFATSFDDLEKSQSYPTSFDEEKEKNVSFTVESANGLDSDPDDPEFSEKEDDCDAEMAEKNKEFKIANSRSLSTIFRMFCEFKLQNVFPHLYMMVKIAVTLAVTSCSTERSFSKLKLIKTNTRSTMGND